MAFYLTFVFNLIAGHLLVSNPRLSYLKQDYWFELKVSGAEPGFFKWGGRGSHGVKQGTHLIFMSTSTLCFLLKRLTKGGGSRALQDPSPFPNYALRFIYYSKLFFKNLSDQYQYLSNCAPTPPLTQQQSTNNKSGQEPITRSFHTNCNLESTLSRIFLFLELRYWGGVL